MTKRYCPKCGIRDCQCPEYLFSVIAEKDSQIAALTEERDEWKEECEIFVATTKHQQEKIASLKELVVEAMGPQMSDYWTKRAEEAVK